MYDLKEINKDYWGEKKCVYMYVCVFIFYISALMRLSSFTSVGNDGLVDPVTATRKPRPIINKPVRS